MKAEDLMIGDWVRITLAKTNLESHKGKVAKVIELRGYPNWNGIKVSTGGLDEYFCERDDEIEPIPLTPEILKKNDFCFESNAGYVLDDYDGVVVIYDEWNRAVRIQVNRKTVFDKEYFDNMAVHELQHALKMCGIKKEIVI